MIIVDGQKLKFLLAGRVLTVEVNREYRKGRDYAVGKTFRKATCRAIVTDLEQIGAKTWRVSLKHAQEHKPVWLAKKDARADYTSEPGRAMLDEPEPIDAAEVARLHRLATPRDDAERRRRAKEMRVRDRAA